MTDSDVSPGLGLLSGLELGLRAWGLAGNKADGRVDIGTDGSVQDS